MLITDVRKQRSAFERLLETLLLDLKINMCAGFTTDVIWVNTRVVQCHMCACR